MRERLTARQVQHATPGRYGDGGGLWLEVSPSGARHWTLRYQLQGRARWMGLGSAEVLALADARERARVARLALLDGIDPLEARQAQRAEQRRAEAATITFREAAKVVIENREGVWNAEHARQWRASIAEVDRVLGSLPVAAIDTPLVLKAVEPIWRRAETTADRTRQRIEVVLDWATARGARQGDNPARWKGHLEHLLKDQHKVTHHEAVPYNELPEFMGALRARSGTAARALEFLVLCASRSGEVLGARWSEIDLNQKTWTVPPERLKTGKKQPDKPHVVPLSPAALKILAGQSRDSEFVFAAPRTGKQMERHALRDALKAMGRSETVHGFRSSFSDWAADNTAFPQEVREHSLAHAIPNKVEAAYRRGALLEKRRRLMDAWAKFCGKPAVAAANVVNLRQEASRA
jgi:integrase